MLLTPDQQRAVDARERVICVDAGAGSGKTRVLVERILSLIERDGVELAQIVAITFTDKAATEMKARLRRACRAKAAPDDARTFSFWRRMERQVETSRISTIHSFCSSVLRENALSRGLDPDFAVLTDAESLLLRTEVVASTLHELLEAEDTTAILAAVEYGVDSLSSILDTLLQQRGALDRLLRDNPCSSGTDVATLWKRAWPQLELLILRSVARSRRLRLYARELDSLAASAGSPDDNRELLRRELLDRLRELHKADTTSRIRAVIGQIRELNAKKRGKPDTWKSQDDYDRVKDLLAAVKTALEKAPMSGPDWGDEQRAADITAAVLTIHAKSADAFRAAKLSRNALDFDDLIVETACILRDESRGEDSVRARTARTIKHLLIDEFQDTDGTQLEIAQSLMDAPGGPSLFIVGDAKQSIYYFRGAEVEVFRRARADAAVSIAMRGNFRTAPSVLKFVNAFFSESGLLEAVETPYLALEPQRPTQGDAQIEYLIPPTSEDKTNIEVYRDHEARMIATRLREACDGPARLGVCDEITGDLRPARYGDAAILLRTLSNVHLYERALREAGIPYTLVAGKGFHERQEVLDLRNFLTVIVSPWDELALTAYLRGPIVGLTDNALVALAGGIGNASSLTSRFHSDVVTGDVEQDRRLARARSLAATFRQQRDRPLVALLRDILIATGLDAIVLRQFMGLQAASNLRKVCALAESFSRTETPSLTAFLRYLDEMAAREIREGEAAAHTDDRHSVTLMTVHKSKGLEFPLVFVADLGRESAAQDRDTVGLHRTYGIAAKILDAQGDWQKPALYEAMRMIRAEEETAELARVLYVAMTRAKEHLFLCGAPVKTDSASWMGSFDELYGVCALEHGTQIDGDGWRATVRRTVGDISARPTIGSSAISINADDIQRHLAPCDSSSGSRVSVAVTTLLHAMFPDPPGVLASTKREGISPALRGTILHAIMQRWDFLADIDGTVSEVLRTEPIGETDEARLRKDASRIAVRLKQHALGERLSGERALEREIPFILRIDTHLVRGTIDALLDGHIIVDYKTGQPTPESLARYEAQLCLYAAALRTLRPVGEISAHLIFVDAKDEMVFDVNVSEARVEAVLNHARTALSALENVIEPSA